MPFPVLSRQKRLIAAAAMVALVTTAVLLIRRAVQHGEMEDVMNRQPAFTNPALEVTFPRFVRNHDETRDLLDSGQQNGLWALETSKEASEVRLTPRGQKL